MPKRGILRINSKTYRIDFLIVYRKAKIDFENGDNYQGEIDIDNPVSIIHGRGVLTAGGVTSTGTFVNGMLQGEGVSQWQDNNKYYEYAGNFCNGKREGTGILYYERNRSSFLKIQWKNNLPVNEGTYHMNGNTFEVMYKDGERVLN